MVGMPKRDANGFFDASSPSILEVVPPTAAVFLQWLEQQSDESEFFPASTTGNLLAQFFRAQVGPERFQRSHSYCAIIDQREFEFGFFWPWVVALAEDDLGIPPSAVHRAVPIRRIRPRLVATFGSCSEMLE